MRYLHAFFSSNQLSCWYRSFSWHIYSKHPSSLNNFTNDKTITSNLYQNVPDTLMAALGVINLAAVGHRLSGSEVCLLPLSWSGVISVGGTLGSID